MYWSRKLIAKQNSNASITTSLTYEAGQREEAYERSRGVAGRSARRSETLPAPARSNWAQIGERKACGRALHAEGRTASERGEGAGIHSFGGFPSGEVRKRKEEGSVVAGAGDGSRHWLLLKCFKSLIVLLDWSAMERDLPEGSLSSGARKIARRPQNSNRPRRAGPIFFC